MRKMLFFVVVLLALLSSGAVYAQSLETDSVVVGKLMTEAAPYLRQYYVGGLYSGSVMNYNKVENNFSARFGGIFEIPLPGKILFHSKLFYEKRFKGDVRLIKKYGGLSYTIGFMPTITRIFNTPNPVTSDGHFIAIAQNAISPGFYPGAMIDNGAQFIGIYYFTPDTGAYFHQADSLQIHAGYRVINRNDDEPGIIRELKFSAYTANHYTAGGDLLLGGALTLKTNRLLVNSFIEHGDFQTYATFVNYRVYREWDIFCSLLFKESGAKYFIPAGWQHLEIGLLKKHSQRFWGSKINYYYGASYQKYPIEMTSIHLQVYLFDKK